jgi:hypothetical protein
LTKFYLAKPLKARALSAAVGSGKTRAAVAHMANPANSTRNFLYVAPTVELGTQTEANLREAIAKVDHAGVRNVHLINYRTAEGKARAVALQSINEVRGHEGQVVVLTTQTFLDVLASIARPELWAVILDEAFAPATFDTFGLGADVQEGWAYFSDVFQVDAAEGYRIVPKEGRKGLVADLADGRLNRAGGKYEGLQKVARAVSNPAARCELVVTPRVAALIEGRPLPAKRKESSESVLEYASYIAPEFFQGFREVLFLSALFEQTILYQLWTKALGVTFEPHPEFPAEMLRDTHGEQGRFLAVGHLLHRDDNSSKENLGRNLLTGEPGEKVQGQRVLDHIIRTASAHFSDSRFLLQTNVNSGYEEGKALVPVNATVIPAHAHGLNRYQDTDNVVALCVTNPNRQQLVWVRDRTGMTARQVTQSFRIHTAYQALGRCSIRRAEPTSAPKTVLVAGVDDAQFLHSLFPGSLWLGQVGELPSLRVNAAKAETKDVGKTKALSEAIQRHLESISDSTSRLSSRSLKSALERHHMYLKPKGAEGEVCIPSQTWSRALAMACAEGCGWRRDGQAVVRVTAADYGFTVVSTNQQ